MKNTQSTIFKSFSIHIQKENKQPSSFKSFSIPNEKSTKHDNMHSIDQDNQIQSMYDQTTTKLLKTFDS